MGGILQINSLRGTSLTQLECQATRMWLLLPRSFMATTAREPVSACSKTTGVCLQLRSSLYGLAHVMWPCALDPACLHTSHRSQPSALCRSALAERLQVCGIHRVPLTMACPTSSPASYWPGAPDATCLHSAHRLLLSACTVCI